MPRGVLDYNRDQPQHQRARFGRVRSQQPIRRSRSMCGLAPSTRRTANARWATRSRRRQQCRLVGSGAFEKPIPTPGGALLQPVQTMPGRLRSMPPTGVVTVPMPTLRATNRDQPSITFACRTGPITPIAFHDHCDSVVRRPILRRANSNARCQTVPEWPAIATLSGIISGAFAIRPIPTARRDLQPCSRCRRPALRFDGLALSW